MSRRGGVWPGLLAFAALGSGCTEEVRAGKAVWTEITAQAGLPEPRSWPDGTYFLPEIMPGGVGILDADGDGILDLWQVRVPPPGSRAISCRLYRRGDLAGPFQDITAEAGLEREGYGQGLAVADADNDGDLDVYVTNYGPDVFWVNRGDGTFEDATARAGLEKDRWTIAAAFCDYDADGYQDLYVAGYLRFDEGRFCSDMSGRQDYCGPTIGDADLLWHNEGDGTFRDRAAQAGIVLPQRGARATGLGLAFLDLTHDGLPDVFVANDGQANQMWVNQGNGTFLDQGIQRGIAYSRDGRTEAGMGVAVGDADGDGFLDLFVTHLVKENNRLFLGTGTDVFRDFTLESGLAQHDLDRTGFGCAFLDYDLDGDLDLAVVNGSVSRRTPLPGSPAGFWGEYAEPGQLFENTGAARFDEVDEKGGSFTARIAANRSLAVGDLDEDGDLDLVLSAIDNSLRVFRNDAPRAGRHWLKVRAATQGRDALGAEVRVRAGERELVGVVLASSSYGASNDPRAHFGLGTATTVDEIRVRWPDGAQEVFPGGEVDRLVVVHQGQGRTP